jgi:predicted ATPase
LNINYEIKELEYSSNSPNKLSRFVVIKNDSTTIHEFYDLSHGHAQLVELLYNLSHISSYKSLIYIENIESYLHPKMIFNVINLLTREVDYKSLRDDDKEKLFEFVDGKSVASVTSSKVIYETQSDIVLKSFQLLVARKEVDKKNISVNYINAASESKLIKLLDNGDISAPLPDEFLEISLDLVINRMGKN